jgi:hypothetical protein
MPASNERSYCELTSVEDARNLSKRRSTVLRLPAVVSPESAREAMLSGTAAARRQQQQMHSATSKVSDRPKSRNALFGLRTGAGSGGTSFFHKFRESRNISLGHVCGRFVMAKLRSRVFSRPRRRWGRVTWSSVNGAAALAGGASRRATNPPGDAVHGH